MYGLIFVLGLFKLRLEEVKPCTERHGRVINSSIEFRSLPRNRFPWQRLLEAFLCLFRLITGHYAKVGHNKFYSHTFKFTKHPTIRRNITCMVKRVLKHTITLQIWPGFRHTADFERREVSNVSCIWFVISFAIYLLRNRLWPVLELHLISLQSSREYIELVRDSKNPLK
jgi:hypothetical protein